MASPLPPDPYLALGVAKDATNATIKSQYRKLVLKFHPDKVQDESQKQAASDEFHKIQTAWEILGDEDKRKRYDAQCDLAALRREILSDRQGGPPRGDAAGRAATYKMSTGSRRGSAAFYPRGSEWRDDTPPTYEERKPVYASTHGVGDPESFDYMPRSNSRKDSDRDRSKRSSVRDERERTKSVRGHRDSKEKDRYKQQKERSRQTDRDIRRDRDYKKAYVEEVEVESSDPDELEKAAQQEEEEPAPRRGMQSHHEQSRQQKDEAQRVHYESDERARKMHSQADDARLHMDRIRGIGRWPESERRPSPIRTQSNKTEYITRNEGRPPVLVRRGSGRPRTSGRDVHDRHAPPARDGERKSDGEHDEPPRRPPPLSQTKSSPADIRLPATEKPRAFSVQANSLDKEALPSKLRRAETMPTPLSSQLPREREARRKDNAPSKASGLRQTEVFDGLPTPVTTPDYLGSNNSPPKYRYHEEYADDHEFPTPDGYRTEIRQPPVASFTKPRFTRSPERMPDRDRPSLEREKARSHSARYMSTDMSPQRPSPGSRTTSTSYAYMPGQGVTETTYGRPAVTREDGGARGVERAGPELFGEIPTTARDRSTRSPRQSSGRYSPPIDGARYGRETRPESIRMQSGHGTSHGRSEETRPSYGRGGSYVYAK